MITDRPLRVLFLTFVLGTLHCSALQRSDELDPTILPAALRPDYEVFAQRCSQCHTLARPLNANVTDMEHWRAYVRRMRRQQGANISDADEGPILRFLQYYTELRRGRTTSGGSGS